MNKPREATPEMIRWIMHTRGGNTIVENHNHGRTWRKVYKDNYGNIEALCLQVLPGGIKYYIPISTEGKYWQTDTFESVNGGASMIVERLICSKVETRIDKETGTMEAYWNIIKVDKDKNVTKLVLTSAQIGYDERLL